MTRCHRRDPAVDPNHLVAVAAPFSPIYFHVDPMHIAPHVDFLCVHLYPQGNNIDELELTLRSAAIESPGRGRDRRVDQAHPDRPRREPARPAANRARGEHVDVHLVPVTARALWDRDLGGGRLTGCCR